MERVARRETIAWMAREVLPHEADLRRWLGRALPPEDVEDTVQEIYCRIVRLPDISHVLNGRTYLFASAKRYLVDHVRRSRIVRIETVAEIEALGLVSDHPSPERVAGGRIELERVRALIASLPERCAQVFELRKIQGLSQREVAAALGLSEHVVENEVVRGLRLIMKAMAERDATASSSRNGSDHEQTRQR